MIPFEELSEALSRWRGRNGLDNAPSGSAAGARAAFVSVTTEEILGEQPTTVTANPLAAVASRPLQEHTNEIEIDSLILDADDV